MLVGLAEDEFVVSEPERVPVERHRVQVDVRVAALRLAGRRAVKVPDRQLCRIGGAGWGGAAGPQSTSRPSKEGYRERSGINETSSVFLACDSLFAPFAKGKGVI